MLKRIREDIKKIYKIIIKPEMNILPGNLAYFFVLSLIPMITLVIIVASLFGVSIESVISLVKDLLPTEASDIVVDFISGKSFDSSVGLFNFAAIVVASNGMYAISSASDILYNMNSKNELKKRIKSIVMLFIIVLLLTFLIIVPMFGNQILLLARENNVLSFVIDDIIKIFDIIKWPLSFLTIYFNIKLIYTIAPSEKIHSKETTAGALMTSGLWIIVTVIFSYYLKHFARYNIIYGNLASIIILIIWVYMLAYVFVFGMAVNSNIYHNKHKDEQTK